MSEKETTQRIFADINSETLRWARERTHFTDMVLSRKVGVSPEVYRKWESGKLKPTMRQLHKIVGVLKQPLQTFYMSKIPDEPQVISEMRKLPGQPPGHESPELILQIQLVVERRDIALRLYRELGETPPKIDIKINMSEGSEKIAEDVRNRLNVKIDEQRQWTDKYDALRNWRASIEKLGILVFQIPEVSIHEMRGFSLALDPLPIIGVNTKDAPRARIFTIMHELTHILRNDKVLHAPRRSWFEFTQDKDVEFFCNNVAAAIIVPREDLQLQTMSLGKQRADIWSISEVDRLVSRYKASGSVIVRRLRELEWVSNESYKRLLQHYDRLREKKEESSGGNFYSNKIAHFGTLLPRLAFRGYNAERLTTSDLSSILGMKVDSVDHFREVIFSSTYE